ncbi:saga-associated factor 29 homolog [Phtheirospermum japonicum]|uniref:Saga-associated factor 29 homolog n=1 Tax=Phtheirospermum japonicum TaxID=374723 RepID=A0A830D7J3_9LAMI|nr:saga-associated factor 29 homolog [Phtheirospermum japonicum]
MSSPRIVAEILENSTELDRLREELEVVLLEVNKMHLKLQPMTPDMVEESDDNSLTRLKMLYIQAKELSENEVTVAAQLLAQLDALLPSATPGQHRRKIEGSEQKKKKRMKGESDVSILESLANLKGEQVAARVSEEDADRDEWFVVRVIHFDEEAQEFEVLDEEPGDDVESGGQSKYKLPMTHIIPFPKPTDLPSVHNFPRGKRVLAVYPETTALYKATVVQAPRKRKTDDYVLEFDDDEEEGTLPRRLVPFHKVVPLPEGYRQ